VNVIGIDEAGRGCWAGPLVAAAVILGAPIEGLADSKQLTASKRDALATTIKEKALAYGIGWVWPSEIDQLGLTHATTAAMSEALSQIEIAYDEIIIDGNYNYLPEYSVRTMIKADALVPVVSAASILAKTERDAYMMKIAKVYPDYHFEKNVGYGTQMHINCLKLNGTSAIHRLSFKPIKALGYPKS
jgi:ribonuclease HII